MTYSDGIAARDSINGGQLGAISLAAIIQLKGRNVKAGRGRVGD